MNTTRIMQGVANLEGGKVNTLRVGDMVGRRPQPKYKTTCERCGAVSVASQSQLTTGAARCVADGCGRAHIGEHLRETGRRFRAKVEAEAEAKRAAREEQERQAEEQAKQEAQAERRRRLQEFTKNEIVNGRDEQLFVSPELRGIRLTKDEAAAFNKEQSDLFVSTTPEYQPYKSNESADAILSYLERNGVRIFDVGTLRAAFLRLKDLELLQLRPAKPREEPITPTPIVRPNVNIARTNEPKTYVGKDWQTGRERTFTQREVDRMSSTEFARAFRVAPTFAETFSAMREHRNSEV